MPAQHAFLVLESKPDCFLPKRGKLCFRLRVAGSEVERTTTTMQLL